MAKMSYDVLIIGAGPAGTATAIALARRGAQVLIIDKAHFPRNKTCGGLLTSKSMGMLKDQLSLPDVEKCVLYETNGFEVHSTTHLINRVFGEKQLRFTSRNVLDHYLLQHAIHLGCDFLQMCLTQIPKDHHLNHDGQSYSFANVVGAYGANSSLALATNCRRARQGLAFGLQFQIPTELVYKADPVIPRIYFGYVSYGWAWVFPHGDYAEVGIAGLGIERQARPILHSFSNHLGIAHLPQLHAARGAWVPYGNFLRRPVCKDVLLVGDAAGFTEPITGEGIYYAMLSGLLAAEALTSKEASKSAAYIMACNQHIVRRLRHALLCRPLLFCSPFSRLSLHCLQRSPRHMHRYLSLLSGEIGYPDYFLGLLWHK